MLEHMFHLQLPLLEKILRPVLVYLFLVVAFRLAGKRELAQMNAFDLVVLLTISNVLQNAAIGEDNTVLGGVIGAASLLAVNYVVVRLVLSHPRIDRLIEGEPSLLIRDGRVLADALERELITEPELLAALRRQGVAEASDVALAMLETGGTISVVPKRPTPEEREEQTIEAAQGERTAHEAAVRPPP